MKNIHLFDTAHGRHIYRGELVDKQTDHPYKGAIIRRIPHNGHFDHFDTAGFQVDHAYAVVDDFDEPAMPEVLQQKYWSPYDAMMAWDLYRYIKTLVKKGDKRTSLTITHEFTCALNMRRRIDVVITALRRLEDLASNAEDFGEPLEPVQVKTLTNGIRGTRTMG